MKKNKVPEFIKLSLSSLTRLTEPVPVYNIDKIGENLTPNMRALRLVMSIAEKLLSMGVAARDVVHMSLGITETYCRRPVHMDVSSTLITISQDRGVDREPLTLMRTIVIDDANYQMIQALQSLALEIRDTRLPLAEAEHRAESILSKPKSHSRWLIYASGGIVSAGVAVLYDASLLMILLSFMLGFLATGMLRWLSRLGMATFYSQVIVAVFVTLAAGLATVLSNYFQLEINTTLLVIGGIVLLVAGLMIVGAFQDAIDEYYVTANARLLKVTMATGGIVVGVIAGLYITTRFGISFPTTPEVLSLADRQTQYIGSLLVAAAFAARNHARLFGMIISGAVGMFGWWVSRWILNFDVGVVIASGMAAAVIGLISVFISRLWRFPSLAIIAAGIVPLVPGLSLYNGMLGIINSPPNQPGFLFALSDLATAVMIGFAIAAGASFGNMIGRPIRHQVKKTFAKQRPVDVPPFEKEVAPDAQQSGTIDTTTSATKNR